MVLSRFYFERQARNDAQIHLSSIKQAYQLDTGALIHELNQVTANNNITSTLSQQPAPSTVDSVRGMLMTECIRYHLSMLAIVSQDRHILVQVTSTNATNNSLSTDAASLAETALRKGQVVSSLQQSTSSDPSPSSIENQWQLNIADPIQNTSGPAGVLLAMQPIDNYFAQELTQQTGENVVLCLAGHIQGMAGIMIKGLTADQQLSEQQICSPGTPNVLHTSGYYLTLADNIRINEQAANSLQLVIVDVEPLYALNSHSTRLLLILIGTGLAVFALGVIIYTLLTNVLFINPLRRLQAYVQALVASNAGIQVVPTNTDEVKMLARSFNLLSESLDSESHALTEQMRNLLIMSDTLISTLNLEHLLGEIVTRLGRIMHAQHVSLLLYGREMLSPWAVAQWSDQQVIDSYVLSNPSSPYLSQQQ
ncbi:MAG: hypothetical protein JOZ18_08545, partial [Chloroflexi bacterium]|nr:hypothetical protein [Chloroflexota bacterium]